MKKTIILGLLVMLLSVSMVSAVSLDNSARVSLSGQNFGVIANIDDDNINTQIESASGYVGNIDLVYSIPVNPASASLTSLQITLSNIMEYDAEDEMCDDPADPATCYPMPMGPGNLVITVGSGATEVYNSNGGTNSPLVISNLESYATDEGGNFNLIVNIKYYAQQGPLADSAINIGEFGLDYESNTAPIVEYIDPSGVDLTQGNSEQQQYFCNILDAEGDATIDWYLDNVSVSSGSQIYTVVADNVDVGSHVLRCDAYDSQYTDSDSVSFNILAPNTAPVINSLTPINANFSDLETQLFSLSATDDGGVYYTDWDVDGNPASGSTNEITLNGSNYALGTHTLTTTVSDGDLSTSTSVDFSVYASCTPSWSCSGYEECVVPMTEASCTSVEDLNVCNESYTGDYSEFTPLVCDYDFAVGAPTGSTSGSANTPAEARQATPETKPTAAEGRPAIDIEQFINDLIDWLKNLFGAK